MQSFAAARTEGRIFARDERYHDALAAFERALVILTTPRTECEAGYVAFRAGDLQRANVLISSALGKLRSDTTSLRAEQRIATAMCLYNSGLVFEALRDVERSRSLYQRSLALRENAAVSARLAALLSTAPSRRSLSRAVPSLPRGVTLSPDEQLFAPLITDVLAGWEDAEATWQRLLEPGFGRAGVLEVRSNEGETTLVAMAHDSVQRGTHTIGSGGRDCEVSFAQRPLPEVTPIVISLAITEACSECEYDREDYVCDSQDETYQAYCRFRVADHSLECARVPLRGSYDSGPYETQNGHEICHWNATVDASSVGVAYALDRNPRPCADWINFHVDSDDNSPVTHWSWEQVFGYFPYDV